MQLFRDSELAAMGHVVEAITLDSNVIIVAGQHREHEFRIENEFLFQNYNSELNCTVRYDPYNKTAPIREHLTELSEIVTNKIVHAKAYVNGVLELEFSGGGIMTVQPLDRHEAWMYTNGDFILACPPGGFES